MPAKVVIYTTRFCPYCIRARSFFKKKGVEYTEIRVGRNRDLRKEMEQRSGHNTVPQIFINNESMGGYDDITALDRQGKLDQKLGIAQDG
ncbi:MAG: glutaredoxin 3 [Thiotrichales bacterium]|nr:MAG: glutaredoxin 3 [Thiotrichales bacterium]